ncbi:DNA ligase 1-like, partial [Oppia nitens]|uniref:DNA ligase 1-like n=1 Tax=Oppia nitens TaxID=1686743 RepID=UPI0023DCC8E9
MTLPPCEERPNEVVPEEPWLEQYVIGVFKVWHIIFSGLFSGLAIVIVLCCLFRCRIPRTKQEIEADFVRRRITKVFRTHLNKIKVEDLEAQPNNLVPVLQKVEKMEISRINKQVSFEAGKQTWRQKLRALFAMEREMTHSSSIDDDTLGNKFEDEDEIILPEEDRAIRKQKETERRVEDEKRMKEISKTVDNAKIDSSSFNVITDQFTILMGFESDKDRKKREKIEKKQKQIEEKQRELDEKQEKKEREKTEKFEKKKKELEEKLMKEETKIKAKKDKLFGKYSEETDKEHNKVADEITIEVNGKVEDTMDENNEYIKEQKVADSEQSVTGLVDVESISTIKTQEPEVEILSPKAKKQKEKEEKKLKEKERKEREKEEKKAKEEKKLREKEEKKELELRMKKEKEMQKLKEKEEKDKQKMKS